MQWLAAMQGHSCNAIAMDTGLQSTTGIAQISSDVRLLTHLVGGGVLLQDVTKGLHVGINTVHHLCLLPQVALHCHIDLIVPATTVSDLRISNI